MAISWQLRGLRGNYGMYVAVTGAHGKLPVIMTL